MDDVNSSFGQLSMSAAEWRPGGNSSGKSAETAKVKEFVPGQGWAPRQEEQEPAEAYQEDSVFDHEATIPSGPSPAPLPNFRGLHSLGVSDDLFQHFRAQALEQLRQMEPRDPLHKAVPLPYCNAFLLDQENRDVFGYPSSVFQVTNRQDGHLYCLRRFDSVRSVSPKIATTVQDRWRSHAPHPNVIPLAHCFVAQRAVFFVHQHVTGAQSLRNYLLSTSTRIRKPVTRWTEASLWSIIVQLVSALRSVHNHQLAVRTMDWNHVMVTVDPNSGGMHNNSQQRLRVHISCAGIVDALEFEARKRVGDLQQEDVRNLGRLVLSIATHREITAATDLETIRQCEVVLSQQYGRELHNLVMTLVSSTPQHTPSIMDVCRVVTQQVFEEQDAVYRSLLQTEQALAAEYDSGRALRLLLKLSFINGRPEFKQDRRWSQSGDCYVLTLFLSYVFHQADGAGYPVMDLGHVVSALNKLDAAVEEQIVLVSRDGNSCMVVTYADVARCLESVFHELSSAAVPPSVVPC